MMDVTLCREHVERLLIEESSLLANLEILLDKEHVFLQENNVDALEQASDVRQSCVGELIRVEEERRSLCRMSGHSGDLAGLESLLKWCDPNRLLQARWANCAARATRCRALNDRNGLVVAARLKRVEGLLNIITGRTQAPTTYGPQGAYAKTNAGRMISSEA